MKLETGKPYLFLSVENLEIIDFFNTHHPPLSTSLRDLVSQREFENNLLLGKECFQIIYFSGTPFWSTREHDDSTARNEG